jgi:predicted nucleotidyltransferase
VSDNLEHFQNPLRDLLELLEKAKIPHVLIGGLAVSQLSRPRLTADIDVLTYLEADNRIPKLIESASNAGFSPRIQGAEAFARQNRVLLLIHNQSRIPVDLSLGMLPFEKEVIQRSCIVRAGDLQIPMPSIEDLIILKAVAHRSVDLLDIEALLEVHPKIDRKRIEAAVGEFSEALEMPEILTDVRSILDRKAS